jgi:hypothetical protein
MRAVVFTATIGETTLAEAVASVQAQTHPCVRHVVVVDGARHEAAVRMQLAALDRGPVPLELVVLPTSTGAHGHFGHRIYGAAGLLVHDDLVFFLDADNTFDPDHVAACTRAIVATDAGWAYALRRIVDRAGRFFCADDADSLGFWPRYSTHYLGSSVLPPDQEEFLGACPYLVDTSCYALRREVLVRWSRCWDLGWGADCVFATELVHREPGVGTGRRTVSYRLDTDAQRDVARYFLTGNELAGELYGSPPPWVAPPGGGPVARPEPAIVRFGRPGAREVPGGGRVAESLAR